MTVVDRLNQEAKLSAVDVCVMRLLWGATYRCCLQLGPFLMDTTTPSCNTPVCNSTK